MSQSKKVILTDEQRKMFEFYLYRVYNTRYNTPIKDTNLNKVWKEQNDINYTTTINGIEYRVYFSTFYNSEYHTKKYQRERLVYKPIWRDGVETSVRVIKTLMRKDQGIPDDEKCLLLYES